MRRCAPITAMLLAGCTVGPDYSRPDTPIPQAYAEARLAPGLSDPQLASWWGTFGDPELDKLVNRAVDRNLDVETAAARIREARANERVAGAAALPEVSAEASATRQRLRSRAPTALEMPRISPTGTPISRATCTAAAPSIDSTAGSYFRFNSSIRVDDVVISLIVIPLTILMPNPLIRFESFFNQPFSKGSSSDLLSPSSKTSFHWLFSITPRSANRSCLTTTTEPNGSD